MSCLDYIARLVYLLYWEWVLGQPSGAAYNYASIEPRSCFCCASIPAPPPTPGSPSLCNTFCIDDTTQLCGGYDGTYVYSEAYQHIAAGSLGCPALSITSSSTTLSTTISSSLTSSSSSLFSSTTSVFTSSASSTISTAPTGSSKIHIASCPKTNY
jgi:hypothetical protein